ncbi:hypothetical protein GCM10023094_40630 [Rhodococcus olei]|uniref:HTH marR-type domain-containing protein n=1 Tax=Rhodococcus olei TaxID=2161675 RepID=A0ABP8PDV8_9NOCA
MATTNDPETSADPHTGDDTDPRLRVVLAELVTNASRLTRLASSIAGGDRPRPWLRALSLLEEYGGLRISEIARLDSSSQPTATALVKQLVDAGLVRRQRDPDDSRAVVVEMTESGHHWLAAARDDIGASLAERMRDLDAERIARLSRSLHDLREFLKDPRTSG